jgi:putative acyl-CoA dehydrogenase
VRDVSQYDRKEGAPKGGEAINQPPPFADVDLYAIDAALANAVAAFGDPAEGPALSAFGRRWGRGNMFEHARLANVYPPTLHAFDAAGQPRDEIEFHPSYHHLMRESIAAGLTAMT